MTPRRRCSCNWRSRSARRSEEHTSELQSQSNLVCRLLLEKKRKVRNTRLAVDSSYRSRQASFLGDGIDNPGHPCRVGVDCSEYDENRKNSVTDTSVNAEGV